ncbi:MAG: transposase [Patescibacteria group bacterium]
MSVAESATCTGMARVLQGQSHDGLYPILNDPRLEWQTLLSSLVLRIVGKLSNGWFIIDDTVIPKQFAKVVENIAWVFSSKEGRSVLGLNIVVLCWSNGTLTIPLAFKMWRKDGAKSKFDLALDLLSYARNFLQLQPKYVVFDSWYASKDILKRLNRWGWTFVCQLKKNRLLNGVQLQRVHRNPYWMERGVIYGNLEVLIVRHGKKYFATNDLTSSKQDILSRYKTRWSIETMFRLLHGKLGMDQCEARSLRAQTAHIALCLMSFLILERVKQSTGKTWYQLRREYSFHPERVDLMFNELKLFTA